MSKIGGIDLEMLAGAALGWSEEKTEEFIDDDGDWDWILYEKLGVELEEFGVIADALIKLTPVLESPLTKNKHHAFVRHIEEGFIAIAKMAPDEEVFNSIKPKGMKIS